MPDGRRRSREHWTDTMEAGPASPPAHVHRLPKVVRVALVGLTAAVFLLAVALAITTVQVYRANQYVQGRGEFRDAEAARMEQENEERLRLFACDLLDQLPAGGLLDALRDRYDCGPGIPFDQLPPDVQRDLQNRRPAPVMPGPAQLPPAPPRPAFPTS